MQRSLLVGCGRNLTKQVWRAGHDKWLGNLTTMDMNPDIGVDVVFDMDKLHRRFFKAKLPFPQNTFDEIGCFNAMEHWGRQGDWRGWFYEMGEFHRILKPQGVMYVLVPIGEDRFADPGHTRFFQTNHFGFLNQRFYDNNAEQNTSCTDYRWAWKKNFEIEHLSELEGHHLAVILRKA